MTDVTAKLFVRADPELGTEQQKESIIRELSALVQRGDLDEYDVFAWGREIRPNGPLRGTAYYEMVTTHIEEFGRWATETDSPLESTFRTRTIDSPLTEKTYTTISLPTICLAFYRNDEVCGVYPCVEGGTVCSVGQALRKLDTDDSPVTLASGLSSKTTVGAPNKSTESSHAESRNRSITGRENSNPHTPRSE